MTTRAKGTGLGLAMVQRISEQHAQKLAACRRSEAERQVQGHRAHGPSDRRDRRSACDGKSWLGRASNKSNPRSGRVEEEQPWRLTSSSSMTRPTITRVDAPASWRTKAMARGLPGFRRALAAIEARGPSLVTLDLAHGSQARRARAARPHRRRHPDLPVVMISGHGDYRDRRRRHQARRLRLYREAVQGRPPRADRRPRARSLEAEAREPRAPRAERLRLRDDRPLNRHQPARQAIERWRQPMPRAHHRSVRLGKELAAASCT